MRLEETGINYCMVSVSIVESICRSLHPKNPISPDKVHNYRIYFRSPLKFVSGWNTEMQKNVLKLLPPELKRKNWNVSIWYACKAIDQNFGYGCWFLDGHVQRRWVMAPTIYIYILCVCPPIIHQCSCIAVDRWAKLKGIQYFITIIYFLCPAKCIKQHCMHTLIA